MTTLSSEVDLLIVGGGINGTGIARDAAGRGLKVVLCEQHDLAQHTSSASSKLIHGGLRYLEHYEFRLVRESLAEREVLLRAAPHLVHPMRFVMPHAPELRPAWMIRAGLLLYDYLARRDTLPASQAIDLRVPPYGEGLKPGLHQGFVYSDCWGDDARLVIANARAAAGLGATILPRTTCVAAEREGAHWQVSLQPGDAQPITLKCRALVNASGPWAKQFLNQNLHLQTLANLKLVKGSHIVVPQLYSGEHAFILQNDDHRVVFVYPYEERYTLIGTTDVTHDGAPGACEASTQEIDYLCRAANRYFARAITPADVVWRYSGMRPLFDDGAKDATHLTRDYTLRVDGEAQRAPVLTVYGGKLTTYRTLAEQALAQLRPWFPTMKPAWTAHAHLPGGDLQGQSVRQYAATLAQQHPDIPPPILRALVSRHGNTTPTVISDAQSVADLGYHFGHTLYEREVNYLLRYEWARTAEDVMWRRSKCGLHLNPQQKQILTAYVRDQTRLSAD